MSAVSIVNVKKNFGNLRALKGVSLEIPKGEFFGLLGPNGAGKTTLIHSMVGLCRPTEGAIYLHGHSALAEVHQAHQLVGFAPQEMNLDRFFSIRKLLMYQAGFFGVHRKQRGAKADQLLETFQLSEKAHLQYYRLSGGMQKRLLIAKALIGEPKILILDEPTAGIDVEQRHMLWDYLRRLNKDGTTIILTTHYIDEAEALCERIGIIHLGEIRELGSPKNLIERYCENRVCLKTSKIIARERLATLPFPVTSTDHTLSASGNIGQITEAFYKLVVADPDCHIEDLHVEKGSLEEVFLKVTGAPILIGEAA